MKYCSFFASSTLRYGFELEGGAVVDLPEAGKSLLDAGQLPTSAGDLFKIPDLKGWLAAGREAFEVAGQIKQFAESTAQDVPWKLSRTQIRIVAPISNPGKIVAIGLNYKDHAREQNVALPEKPLIFAKFPTSIIGHDEPIKLPAVSEKVDPEAELCVVILQRCRKVSREAARSACAFMVGNDVSARDLQYSDKQWVRGKSCDTFAPIGPFVVTLDEVGDPHALDITLTRNGELQQSSNTRELIFDCYELVSYISQTSTLEPGDIIFTGTPSGVGVFRDPPVFLEPGDVIEVSIEKLGVLRNSVVAG